VEISHFKSGLACTNSTLVEGQTGWICHVTEDIRVTDQGRCQYDGKDYLCTWVGFEFDYRGAKPGDKLDCSTEQSQPTSAGNPNQELETSSTKQEFSLPLKDSQGHFFNPQYFTFVTRAPKESLLIDTGRCSFKGKTVFEYTYRLQYPERPEHGSGV